MKLFYVAMIAALLAFSAFGQTLKPDAGKATVSTDIVVEVEGGSTGRIKATTLAKLERTEVKATDHDGKASVYSGFELRTILVAMGAKLGKDLKGPAVGQYLIVEAADGYRAVYSLTDLDPEFADKTVILADTCDGNPLDTKNGPWQVIATNEKKHARWVRQVTALRVKIAK